MCRPCCLKETEMRKLNLKSCKSSAHILHWQYWLNLGHFLGTEWRSLQKRLIIPFFDLKCCMFPKRLTYPAYSTFKLLRWGKPIFCTLHLLSCYNRLLITQMFWSLWTLSSLSIFIFMSHSRVQFVCFNFIVIYRTQTVSDPCALTDAESIIGA